MEDRELRKELERIGWFRELARRAGVTAGLVPPFRRLVLGFYRRRPRSFPWRETRDPYRILVSEAMLQQTQVERVLGRYEAFLERFPDLQALGDASPAEVLAAWQGLGYNRRALNLREAARRILRAGSFPREAGELEKLPGIGPASAAAVVAFAFNLPSVLIETNTRRVFLHCFFPGKERVADRDLLPVVERTVDAKNPRRWYWALMDLGSFLGDVLPNPNRRSAHYSRQAKFEGSLRQARGGIVRALLRRPGLTAARLASELDMERERVRGALSALEREGLVEERRGRWKIRSGSGRRGKC